MKKLLLIIVLAGAGLSDLPFFPIPMALPVAMWILAVASLITVGQRLHSVRTSPAESSCTSRLASRRCSPAS